MLFAPTQATRRCPAAADKLQNRGIILSQPAGLPRINPRGMPSARTLRARLA